MRLLRKLFVFLLFSAILSCFCTYGFAAPVTKLYRNRDYQFSIKIPDNMEYTTPRGPNVKMAASTDPGGLSMNIIVKSAGGIESCDDEMLEELHKIQVIGIENSDGIPLGHEIISIPMHRVLCEKMRYRYTYPDIEFWLDAYTFTLVTSYKLYVISYFMPIGEMPKHTNEILTSIGSFVDETGWY